MHTHCAGDTEAAAAAAVAAADAADMPADAADMFRAAAVYLRAVRDEAMHFAVYADAATKYFGTAAHQAPDDLRGHADELYRRCLDKMCRLSNTVRAAREMIGAHSHFHYHSILLRYQVEL